MAKIVNNFTFSGSNGASKYQWSQWLDGQVWQLGSEDFGATKLKTMKTMARRQAKNRGLKLRVKMNAADGTVTIQAFSADAEPAASNGDATTPATNGRKGVKGHKGGKSADAATK